MWSKQPKAIRPGKQISVRDLNQARDAIGTLTKIRGGSGVGSGGFPFGPTLRPAAASYRFGITGSGGIPSFGAPGSDMPGMSTNVADFQIQLDANANATASQGTTTFTAYNVQATPVPANTITLFIKVWGVWVAIYGGVAGIYFCVSPAGVLGATGTFPKLTPGTGNAQVYQAGGNALTLVTFAALYNWFPAAPTAGRVTQVFADGTGAYVYGPQSCS
jgi:hypothetical protein